MQPTVEQFRAHLCLSEEQLSKQIEAGIPLPDVLSNLALSIESFACDEMIVSVLLLDADGIHLRLGAAPSLPPAYNRAIDGIEIGPRVGSCGTAAYFGHSIFVVDIETNPLWADFKDLALRHGLKSCWSVPIYGETGKILGTLALYHRHSRSPSSFEMELIEIGGKAAGQLIEQHRQSYQA